MSQSSTCTRIKNREGKSMEKRRNLLMIVWSIQGYNICSYSAKSQCQSPLISQCRWTMTWSILRKQRRTFVQVNYLTWFQLSMHFVCWGQNNQELKTAAVKTWQNITREEAQHLTMTSDSHLLILQTKYCNQVLEVIIEFMIMVVIFKKWLNVVY